MKNSKNFTIIELIAIIVMLGILAVAVAPSFDQGLIHSSKLSTSYALLRTDIRYIQTKALINDTNKEYALSINNNGYEILINGSPSSESFPAALNGIRTFDGIQFTPFTITFTDKGETDQNYTITLSVGGTSKNLILQANGRIVE